MIPTKITEEPFLQYNGARGVLIFPTDAGLLDKFEIAKLIGVKPGTFYERVRRIKNQDNWWKRSGLFNQQQFNHRAR